VCVRRRIIYIILIIRYIYMYVWPIHHGIESMGFGSIGLHDCTHVMSYSNLALSSC